MPCRIDLHTHTYASGDSTTTVEEFVEATGRLSVVAVTDHNEIGVALEIGQALSIPVIVGEEVSTADGDLIGLFLHQRVPKGWDAARTASAIREQGGLVYAPHPFDRRRRSLDLAALTALAGAGLIDIVEVANSKQPAFNAKAAAAARRLALPAAAGSDAHVPAAIGSSFVEVDRETDAATSPAALVSALTGGKVRWSRCDPARPYASRVVPGIRRDQG